MFCMNVMPQAATTIKVDGLRTDLHVYNAAERWKKKSEPFMRSELLNPSTPGAYPLRY